MAELLNDPAQPALPPAALAEGAPLNFYFLVWVGLQGDRANSVMILKTCEALARLMPAWRVHLRFSELSQNPQRIVEAMGLTLPENLEIGTLFPIGKGAPNHDQIGQVLHNTPGKVVNAIGKACRDYWLDQLGAGRAVIHTRNLRVIDYFRELNVPQVPLFMELHQLKYLNKIQHKSSSGTLSSLKQALRECRTEEFNSIRKADLVYCISGSMAHRLHLVDPRIRTAILRSAAELPPGLNDAGEPGAHEPERDIDLLYTGQLYYWKGVHQLIEALRHMPPRVRLTVVGGNNQGHLYVMQKVAENFGVADRIDWLGQMPHKQTIQYQLRAKIGLVPLPREYRISRWYTSPIKVFELMAAGGALLVSDLPSMRDILEPGRTAEFARAGDARDWAAKIERLLGDDDYRQSLAREARRTVHEFTFDARARLIRDTVFEHLVAPVAPELVGPEV